jgi:hypothetical protein
MDRLVDDGRLPLGEPEQPQRESKAQAFERMALKRVARALDDIRLVGNLANRGSYDYDGEQVADIVAVLRQGLADVESRFRVNSPREPFAFRRR